MPPSSRYSRASSRSPTRSMSYTSNTSGQQRTNIVKRLAITGNAQREVDGGRDGAAIKMYLRIALPVNSVVPGSTIPLFPEDNLKILKAAIHPLDNNFVPYNFAPDVHNSLLTKAARALNLPPRSRESYLTLFGASPSSSLSPSTLDKKYVGDIGVSGYHVSYILPKEFPPRVYESENFNKRSTNELHFMAAIDLYIPYTSSPPYSPYLVSIPVPRCLSNNIRLRIFPPDSSLTSSMASLSSAGSETSSWDLTSDPPVSRTGTKRLARTNSYNNFADDESSDSSVSRGFAEGYGIQGSFPSTERIRVRWASPVKAGEVPETSDGRRRVGIKDVKGDMTCSVFKKHKSKVRGRRDASESGVVMKVECNATCRGVWFPGVATMLGMDVALDVGDCDVSWASDGEGKWTISGGAGFTGFAVGAPPKPTLSRQSSADTPPIYVSPSSPHGPNDYLAPTRLGDAHSHSPASLLRAPLPSSNNAGDVSFDESPSPTTTPLSSIASLATIPSSPERDRRSRASSSGRQTDTDAEEEKRPPKVPITIHLNMNELGPPSKNEFTFSISGMIVVRPRSNGSASMFISSPISSSSTASEDENESSAILPLPQFHVLYTDKESLSTIVLNELDSSSVDIYNSTGNIADAQSRKTVLQPGGKTKCGSDGARFAIRTLPSQRMFLRREASTESVRRPPSRPRTPSYIQRNASATSIYRDRQSFSFLAPKPRRDGRLMIPSVSATITPLATRDGSLPTEYAVRVSLPAPSEADSEWLEFGLAQPPSPSLAKSKAVGAPSAEIRPPRVEVASASIEGVPVLFETSAAAKPDSNSPALGLTFEETSAKEWITWVKVHVGEAGGGNVQVVYLVRADKRATEAVELPSWWRVRPKGKSRYETSLDVLLPTFSLPVGTMEVNVESQHNVDLTVKSNLTHQQTTSTGLRLLHYSLEEFFYPNLTVTMCSTAPPRSKILSTGWRTLGLILCMMPTVMALLAMADKQLMSAELAQAHRSLESCTMSLETPADLPDPIIITTTATTTTTTVLTSTVYTSSSAKWWQSQDVPAASQATTSVTSRPESPPYSSITPLSDVSVLPSTTLPPISTETALSVVRDMPFLWPIRFDIPSLEIPEAARATATTIWRAAGIAWYLFQKMLHYPLDPP